MMKRPEDDDDGEFYAIVNGEEEMNFSDPQIEQEE